MAIKRVLSEEVDPMAIKRFFKKWGWPFVALGLGVWFFISWAEGKNLKPEQAAWSWIVGIFAWILEKLGDIWTDIEKNRILIVIAFSAWAGLKALNIHNQKQVEMLGEIGNKIKQLDMTVTAVYDLIDVHLHPDNPSSIMYRDGPD